MVCYLDLRPVSKQKNITLHHQVWRETASLRACRIPFAGREHMFQNAELRSSSGRQWPRTPHDGLDQWAVRSLREAVSHAAACVVCGTVYTTSARKKYQVFSITWTNKWPRGWDSNPRYARAHNGFRDRALRHFYQKAQVQIEAASGSHRALENRMIKVQTTLVASPRNHFYRTGHPLIEDWSWA
jgi:hypothetical protein